MRGLDEEEAKFLDFVSDQQEKVEKSRQTEEDEAIHEYRVSFVPACFAVVSVANSVKTCGICRCGTS